MTGTIPNLKKPHWHNYIWQPLIAIVFICMVLICFNFVATTDLLWAVGAGALTSSAFIVFGIPSTATGAPKKIFFGYLIGIACGIVVRIVLKHFLQLTPFQLNMPDSHWLGMFAAITVGISILIMAMLHCEHPPAAGISLVLVIDIQQYNVLSVILGGVVVLTVLRVLLDQYLKDLNWKNATRPR